MSRKRFDEDIALDKVSSVAPDDFDDFDEEDDYPRTCEDVFGPCMGYNLPWLLFRLSWLTKQCAARGGMRCVCLKC